MVLWKRWRRRLYGVLLCALFLGGRGIEARIQNSPAPAALFRSELLFPPQHLHNHGSCVVEMPHGGLFACWYRGSGERGADDVAVMGARLANGARHWEAPFVLADTPGFPDTNPCLFIDPFDRLWLFHSTILDNHWESALTRYRVSGDYRKPGRAPVWQRADLLLCKPGPEFQATVERDLARLWEPTRRSASPQEAAKIDAYLTAHRAKAGDKLAVRLGWMTRAHPTLIRTGGLPRLLVPLYSDGFDFSLIAFTDDWGATWQVSAPIVGPGNVQPSIVQRKDGSLVAFFRDNGPPPKRVMQAESEDGGQKWSSPHDLALPDPGAGLEAIVLKSGRWLLVNNDTERGRHSLAVSVSEDEGRTWAFRKHLEHDAPGPDAGSYAYPSVLQARDGSLHVTYSYTPNKANAQKQGQGESIKHVQFNEAWLLAQEGREYL
jgi:predicted neuraminidase